MKHAPNSKKIQQSVRSFLSGPHNGALMINGTWGSGKTYFVKHELFDFIKTLNVPQDKSTKEDSNIASFDLIRSEFNIEETRKYTPIIVSTFGLKTIKDLKAKIVEEWLDNVSMGVTKKFKTIRKQLEKFTDVSQKLKEWVNLSKLFEINPGLSMLPKNIVICLDDLERSAKDFTGSEMMGFINELSENLGFKVILITNNEYLHKYHSESLDFMEKVVERTLRYVPDTLSIAYLIAGKYSDPDFLNLIKGERISNTLNPTSQFSISREGYPARIENLRTIQFLINRFYRLYEQIKGIEYDRKDALILDCWYALLALSLEFKANQISWENPHGVPEYEFDVRSANLNLEDIGIRQEELDNSEQGAPTDEKYCEQIKRYYYGNVADGIVPMICEEMFYYVVGGFDLNLSRLVELHSKRTALLFPEINQAYVHLARLMDHLYDLSNDEIKETVNLLYQDVCKGKLLDCVAYVNAATYILHYRGLIENAPADVESHLKQGFDIWFDSYDALNDFEKSRFSVISSEVQPIAKPFYQFINERINQKEEKEHAEDLENMKRLFSENLVEFCKVLTPHPTPGTMSSPVTYWMMNPFLHKIPKKKVVEAIRNITPAGVRALVVMLDYRFLQDTNTFKYLEKEFLVHIDSLLTDYNPEYSASVQMVKDLLEPTVTNILSRLR